MLLLDARRIYARAATSYEPWAGLMPIRCAVPLGQQVSFFASQKFLFIFRNKKAAGVMPTPDKEVFM